MRREKEKLRIGQPPLDMVGRLKTIQEWHGDIQENEVRLQLLSRLE
jgi:hypothetical protein